MGFFSGIFGSGSEWDGNKYVESVTGNKFWHTNFIDMDAMRRLGSETAQHFFPMDVSRISEQSPYTLVGELVYLMNECEAKGDLKGQKAVSRAMARLIETHGEKLSPAIDVCFMMTGYASLNLEHVKHDVSQRDVNTATSSIENKPHDLMEEARLYGITYDGQRFHFQDYSYEKLEDAINYAMLVERKR